jgi:hypothetical protein
MNVLALLEYAWGVHLSSEGGECVTLPGKEGSSPGLD